MISASKFQYGLVVDDHADARRWLVQALQDAFPGILINDAHDLASAHAAITVQHPDIAVIDLGLPDGSGVELIRALHHEESPCYKIVSTMFGDDGHLFEALRAGAEGYVLKDEARSQLADLLRGIVDDQPPLSASIARRLLHHFHEPVDEEIVRLTEREHEVLTLIAKGYTVKKVAGLLDISVNTTAGYVKNIYRKLNISSRAEATLEASRLGLINLDPG